MVPALLVLLGGCQTDQVSRPTAALTLAPESMAKRQAQSRRFDTEDERLILSAAAGVLQDLGFSIDESSLGTGLVVASKDRAAVESDQVAGQMMVMLLAAMAGATYNPVFDRNQKIRVSVVTTPNSAAKAVVARVTFQRIVWNTMNVVSRSETIDDPRIYREFFEKLSKSVFLEGHEL